MRARDTTNLAKAALAHFEEETWERLSGSIWGPPIPS